MVFWGDTVAGKGGGGFRCVGSADAPPVVGSGRAVVVGGRAVVAGMVLGFFF